MTNPTSRDAATRKVVAAARAVIAHDVGLPIGIQRLHRALSWLTPHEAFDYPAVDGYLKDVTGLPLGSERLRCSQEALARFDKSLEAARYQWRTQLLETCHAILARFGTAGVQGEATPSTTSSDA